jgi:hypothetical protein
MRAVQSQQRRTRAAPESFDHVDGGPTIRAPAARIRCTLGLRTQFYVRDQNEPGGDFERLLVQVSRASLTRRGPDP